MLISVKTSDPKRVVLFIPLPTALLCSRLTAAILAGQIRKYNPDSGEILTYKQIYAMMRLYRKFHRDFKRSHPGFELVNVSDSKGNRIKIKM